MGIKDSTKKNYTSHINTLQDGNFNPRNFEHTCEQVDDISKNISTQKNYYSSILWFLRQYEDNRNLELEKKYSDLIININKQQIKKRNKNILSDKQKTKFLHWLDVLKTYEKIKKESKKLDTVTNDLILLSLYIYNPPRRIKDYSQMFYYKRRPKFIDNEKNYYISGTKPVFIFNNYKTDNTFKQQIINVKQKHNEIIQRYIEHKILKSGDSFLDMSDYSIITTLQKIFEENNNVKASINILRISYISYLTEKNKLNTVTKRLKVGNLMAHGINEQLLYNKIDSIKHKPKKEYTENDVNKFKILSKMKTTMLFED